MSQNPVVVEKTDFSIRLDVVNHDDSFDVLHLSYTGEYELSMRDVAAIFEHMAAELQRGNFECLGKSQ